MKGQEIIDQIVQKEMPDVAQVRARCITQNVPQKSPHFRTLIVFIVLVAVLGTTALGVATDGFKFLFGAFAERADLTTRYNEDVLVKDYTLEFSHFDEIRSLFYIRLGNAFMDNVRQPHTGELSVSKIDGIDDTVCITSYFSIDTCNLKATIFVPLLPDEQWVVAYADYAAADNEVKYIYEGENGITARVIIDERALPDWTLDLRFVFDGAYYIIQSDRLMQTSDWPFDLDEIAMVFVDAF